MTRNKIIEVNSLSASFGDKQVLDEISFDIFENEITVLLGSSGSGKTTVLKHLIGLYPVQQGNVYVLNQNIAELEEDEQNALYLKMGVFFQNGALLNSLSVGENIMLPLEQHTHLSEEFMEQLVRLKLSLVNLEYAYDQFPSELSGGMLKRAALARAIATDPPLLFCDEPGAGLDPISLASLDRLILNLKNQLGITVVLVTHEVASIRRLADRIIFLDQGKIIFQGPMEDAMRSDHQIIKDFFHLEKIQS